MQLIHEAPSTAYFSIVNNGLIPAYRASMFQHHETDILNDFLDKQIPQHLMFMRSNCVFLTFEKDYPLSDRLLLSKFGVASSQLDSSKLYVLSNTVASALLDELQQDNPDWIRAEQWRELYWTSLVPFDHYCANAEAINKTWLFLMQEQTGMQIPYNAEILHNGRICPGVLEIINS